MKAMTLTLFKTLLLELMAKRSAWTIEADTG
jgi:hypothetical protein